MPQHNLVAVIGLAILNGMFSPALIPVFALHGLWYPFFLPAILPAVFLACSLIISTFTLMLGAFRPHFMSAFPVTENRHPFQA